MMQKYSGSSIENKKVDGDCGKAESVQNLLIIYLKKNRYSKTCEKYVKGQNVLLISSMKTLNERVLWNTPYILYVMKCFLYIYIYINLIQKSPHLLSIQNSNTGPIIWKIQKLLFILSLMPQIRKRKNSE